MYFAFEMEKVANPEQLSPLALAYIGDAVLELFVRTHLVAQGYNKVNVLHKKAVKFVNASTQASLLRLIEDNLTEAERAIVRRGRNAKSGHVPKNASLIDYRYSTGLESLLGYLYLKGEAQRVKEIFTWLQQMMAEETGE